MKTDLCYIIIVHYNSLPETINCIKSIYTSSNKNYKIILVDNYSSDNSLAILKKEYKIDNKIVFIESNYNGGYAYGLNLGIKFSLKENKCTHLWLINNDVVITENTLKELLISDKSTNEKYIWGSKILNMDNTVQSVGCKLNKYFMTSSHNYKNSNDSFNITNNEFDYIHGCSIFLKKDLIRSIGFLDENYFLFYEDVDFSYSAKLNKIALGISKESKIFHKENITVKKMNYQYLATLNRIKFARKYFKNMLPFVYLGIFYEIFKNLCLLRFNRNYLLIKHLIHEFS